MSVQAWTFVMVGLSFAIYIGVAIWSRASSTGEFYIAGAGVPPVVNGMGDSSRLDECRIVYFDGGAHFVHGA